MDIGPVERIGPVNRTGLKVGPNDVTPALGVEGSARMEDDSYQASNRNQNRGMEEDEEASEDDVQEESASGPVNRKNKGVNCFA
ncbi:MAG: hypothetical protein JST28_22540 [Acidobacteria bacterium]|nr:hypothetical protein [Acidobacteriota bacterium]